MANPDGERQRAEIEAWWALIVRILAFIFGLLLICYDAAFMMGDQTAVRLLIATGGFSMMGPVIAGSIAQIVHASRGVGDE